MSNILCVFLSPPVVFTSQVLLVVGATGMLLDPRRRAGLVFAWNAAATRAAAWTRQLAAAWTLVAPAPRRLRRTATVAAIMCATVLLLPDPAFALDKCDGPWCAAVNALCKAFYGPIGQGLSLIAIIIGGLMFAFGEGGSKSQIAGLIFGSGLVLQAPAFLGWLGMTQAACVDS